MNRALIFTTLILGSLMTNSHTMAANLTDFQSFINPSVWKHFQLSPSVFVGDANGQFDWNIAADPSGLITPNVLSELSYDDLNITKWHFETLGELPLSPHRSFITEFQFATGVIDNGQVRDSDYDDNNKNGEYSRSHSNPKGSELVDYSVAAGLSQQFNYQWSASALVGYSLHEQNFSKRDGEQVLSTDFRTPNVGKFGGLDSDYHANWNGGWLGMQLHWKGQKQGLNVRLEQHFVEYYAEANWNLRTDFAHPKSFDHIAIGQGTIARFEYEKTLNRSFNFMARYQIESWEATNGIDTVYFANGQVASTKLNSTNWTQTALSFGLKYTPR